MSHRQAIANHIAHVGRCEVTCGLLDGVPTAGEFLYMDHSYFDRGWEKGNFRLIRRGVHLTEVLKRPDDRLRKLGVCMKDWRRNGNHVVMIVPSELLAEHYKKPHLWKEMLAEVQKYTDRPVEIVRKRDHNLKEKLAGAWAVVCPFSTAGVEAALSGIPVFSTPECPSWPVNAGELSQIENPELKDRYDWLCSLSYACWSLGDMPQLEHGYRYTK